MIARASWWRMMTTAFRRRTVARRASPPTSLAAWADGYNRRFGDGGTVAHIENTRYRKDGDVLNPARPETLVYVDAARGPLLVGVVGVLPPTGLCPPGSVNVVTPEMVYNWMVDKPGGPFAEKLDEQFITWLQRRSWVAPGTGSPDADARSRH